MTIRADGAASVSADPSSACRGLAAATDTCACPVGFTFERGICGRPASTDEQEPLGPSTALGANLNDRCSPVGEGPRLPWARCEERRGLRCQRPPRGFADGVSLCVCAGGGAFADGVCSGGDAGTALEDAGVEGVLELTGALGENVGDRCEPGPSAEIAWARCDGRRGLVCAPADAPDAGSRCACPAKTRFVEGGCTPG